MSRLVDKSVLDLENFKKNISFSDTVPFLRPTYCDGEVLVHIPSALICSDEGFLNSNYETEIVRTILFYNAVRFAFISNYATIFQESADALTTQFPDLNFNETSTVENDDEFYLSQKAAFEEGNGRYLLNYSTKEYLDLTGFEKVENLVSPILYLTVLTGRDGDKTPMMGKWAMATISVESYVPAGFTEVKFV